MAWWILQNMVIAGVLAALVWVICRIGRVGPVGRHALWLLVLLKLITPPLVVWPWALHTPLDRIDPAVESTRTSPAVAAGSQSPEPGDAGSSGGDQINSGIS